MGFKFLVSKMRIKYLPRGLLCRLRCVLIIFRGGWQIFISSSLVSPNPASEAQGRARGSSVRGVRVRRTRTRRTRAQAHTCTRAQTHTHTRTRAQAHTRTHTQMHTCTNTHAHVHRRTRTHTHTQTQTHTRTQACTFAFQTGGGEETGEPGASTCSPPRSNRRGGVGDRGVCDGERVHAVTAVVMRRAHRRTHIGDLALPGTTAKFCTSVTSINHRKDLMCLYYYYPHSAQEGADGQE